MYKNKYFNKKKTNSSYLNKRTKKFNYNLMNYNGSNKQPSCFKEQSYIL